MKEPIRPAVTVATVVERGGRFLLVEEETRHGLRLNQPAGHVEGGESLVSAAARETLEEAAWRVDPTALVGTTTPVVVHAQDPDRLQYAEGFLHFICEAINPWMDRPLAELRPHPAGQARNIG